MDWALWEWKIEPCSRLIILLTGTKKQRGEAAQIIGSDFAMRFWKLLPPKTNGWKCLSLVGRRADPCHVIAESLISSGLSERREMNTPEEVIEELLSIALASPKRTGGLIIAIDEMGKFLENAALLNGDVYFSNY